jgi:aldose 1-epimerase
MWSSLGCSSASPRAETALQAEAAAPGAVAPGVQKAAFGALDGVPVDLYTLTNAHGLVLRVTTYGAAITELHVPDRNGKADDIVLGFADLDGYRKGSSYFGAIVGRVANRIRGATFTLAGKEYTLAKNNGADHLHGGQLGWDKVVWTADPSVAASGALRLTYVSKSGEEGYPGTVTASVTYTLTDRDELKVAMHASTDQTTLVNLAQHTYWNLGGFASGSVLDQELTLFADGYTPGDPQIPTGVVQPVAGTPFDFTTAKPIGKDIARAGGTPVGFDQNFVVRGDPNALRPVARVKDPESGRVMTLEADQPGVQLYSANHLDGTVTGKGAAYVQYAAFCLETQKFPNAINVPAWRDQVILEPGKAYEHQMLFRFTTE